MDVFYKHYIRTDAENNITSRYSNSQIRDIPPDAILYNAKGGYQFQLVFLDGTVSGESPSLMNDDGVYLYRYVNGQTIAKTPQEIQAEMDALPKSPTVPTIEERQAVVEAAIREMAGEMYK